MLNPDFAQPGLAITSQTKSCRVTPKVLRGYELNVMNVRPIVLN